jgi:D-glycero-D-manno-heptose 1,7-bisphosphate phosphatase
MCHSDLRSHLVDLDKRGFVIEYHSNSLRPAVFLDRDGTVNVEVHYLSQPDQLELLPTVSETISMLNTRGIAVVVVTNQAGIARGYFPEHRLVAVHDHLIQMLSARNATLDGIYYCPHHPTAGLGTYRISCDCRKPMPGMLTRAAAELGLDLTRSVMIGDRKSDLEAGANAGCQTALVLTGYGKETSAAITLDSLRGIGIFHSVAEAVNAWLDQ